MKIIAKLSRSKVAAGAGHDLDLLVRLRAPAATGTATRPPLCLVPVVDVSGSMDGDKIAAVRRALERLVAHLLPGDHVGLVTFDSQARPLVPVVEVTETRKTEFVRIVRGLRAGSQTNLAGGLLEGTRIVRDAKLAASLRPRLVLLTDGQANQGPATSADDLKGLVRESTRGVTISAFGYGDDCDQALLGDVADAGAGRRYCRFASRRVYVSSKSV